MSMGKIGDELILGMENAVAHARGTKRAARETVVAVAIPARVDVAGIRRKLGLSQEAFARLVGARATMACASNRSAIGLILAACPAMAARETLILIQSTRTYHNSPPSSDTPVAIPHWCLAAVSQRFAGFMRLCRSNAWVALL
jgi:hypothetical protein